MQCPRCQHEDPAGQTFCGDCGTSLRATSEGSRPGASYAELQRELSEAREQQTATAEILRVISSSSTDVQPVFDTIVNSAPRLCDATFCILYRFDGELLHLVAHHNVPGDLLELLQRLYPMQPWRQHASGRAIISGAVVEIEDVLSDPEYQQTVATMSGWRSMLAVPMLRERVPIGAIVIQRAEAGSFPEAQIALIQTFADQAVIAIENVRLFKELQEKNRALTEAHAQVSEALEQQTATAEVLRVISTSPTDLQPVLDTVVMSAARFCGASDAEIFHLDGGSLKVATHHGPIPSPAGRLFPVSRGSVAGRAVLERRPVHVADLQAEAAEFPEGSAFARESGYRTVLVVPLLREGTAVGTINLRRAAVNPFTDKQSALLQTFADQAVIAIENVRLFKELEARNAELAETLTRQTATGEVLRAISLAQIDAQPVFDIIAASALRLCDAGYGQVALYDGEWLHLAALDNVNPEGVEALRRRFPLRPDPGSAMGRAIHTRAVVQIFDVLEDPAYAFKSELVTMGFRSILVVPMLRQGEPIGAIGVGRYERGLFSAKQIELLQTFAHQAVIAIENVRLFKELQTRTQELTRSVGELQALGEVGQAVSSTLDLETVLTTIVSRAVQLSGTDGGTIYEYDEAAEEFTLRATHNLDVQYVELRRGIRLRKGEGVTGRMVLARGPVQVPDITAPGAYDSRLREGLLRSGAKAVLAVPLLREDHLIGGLVVNRNRPGEFPPQVVELLQTFATQSALAIQNARLFREIAEKSRQLETASRHKSEFLANMSHELRTPLNAIIGFSEVLAEKMFGDINDKQAEFLQDILESGRHLLSLINDILDLSKIEAGRMQLEPADLDLRSAIDNALILVRERASRRGITLASTIDERLGLIRGDERKVKQVLLNLLSNALKFTPEGGRIDVGASLREQAAEVSVADTGIGIAPADQEAVFEEFRQVGTADKRAEGTGLGLALSRKFIELHGGKIWVQSEVGRGSTFTFTLPVGPWPAS
jgi:two-component system, NtrC family, sensor kinase